MIERDVWCLRLDLVWLNASARMFCHVAQRCNLPPLRNPPEVGVLEAIGEEVGDGLGQTWIAAFGLGAGGGEIHEPGFKQRPRDRPQRLVHPAVEFDLVVQRAEDVCDGTLFGEWGYRNLKLSEVSARDACNCYLTTNSAEQR